MVRARYVVVFVLVLVGQSVVAPVTAVPVAPEQGTDRLSGTEATAPDLEPVSNTGASVSNRTTGTQSNTIVEHREFDRLPDEQGRVEMTYRYELPSSVESLATTIPALDRVEVSVTGTAGFDHEEGANYTWDERTSEPSITVELLVPGERMNDIGVEQAGFAFAFSPDTRVSWRYRDVGPGPSFDIEPAVDGEGFAADSMAYAGPAEVISGRTVQGTEASVVVADSANLSVDPDELGSVARILVEDFRLGRSYDTTGVFVLPDAGTPSNVSGQNLGDSYWVQDSAARLDTVRTTVTHEFAHTRIGSFREGTSQWLTEATAEYYGYVLALNQGSGDFAEFQDTLAEYETEYAPAENPAVLTEPDSWRGTVANYENGALVLAALDARIRNRTDGEHRLRDVLAVRFRSENNYNGLNTYADFRRAVVEVTGEDDLGPWLDRYATTEAVPSVPENPYHFVTRWNADPDRDTLTSEEEREAGTNPFDEDTDDDGLRDFIELREDLDPTSHDTDDDGLTDDTERDGPTDATNPDTDGDGELDGEDEFPTDDSRATPTPTPTPDATPTTTGTAVATDGAEASAGTSDERTTEVAAASGPGPGLLGAAVAALLGVLLLVRRADVK